MSLPKATEIKMALLRLGISQAQIARQYGVSRAAVNNVVHGRVKSHRLEEYLSSLVKGMPQA